MMGLLAYGECRALASLHHSDTLHPLIAPTEESSLLRLLGANQIGLYGRSRCSKTQ